MIWIIENEAFANGDILLPVLKSLGKDYILWDDNYWNTEEYKSFPKESIFHGSLGNAERIRKLYYFSPGSICNEVGFRYSDIYEIFKTDLLNQDVIFTTISEVIKNPSIIKQLKTDKLFARPDSHLKEFSGRIIPTENLTPAHFDYGFYHENINLPIVLAPLKRIEKEFRFICVDHQIVTGCEYVAEGRKGGRTINTEDKDPAYLFAQKIADENTYYHIAYVIDVCISDGKFYLVEMNPFSGADFYNCDAKKIIQSVESYLIERKKIDEYYDSSLVQDVWHEDHRFKSQILSRCHEEYSVDILLQDGLYSVKVYMEDPSGKGDMVAYQSFSTLEEAKEFAISKIRRKLS